VYTAILARYTACTRVYRAGIWPVYDRYSGCTRGVYGQVDSVHGLYTAVNGVYTGRMVRYTARYRVVTAKLIRYTACTRRYTGDTWSVFGVYTEF